MARQPPEEQREWRQSFAGYRAAWAATWRFVERYECQEIPEQYRDLEVSEETPLAFLIADPADEGIPALAFTQWLVQQHNQVVGLVAAVRGVTEIPEVSSRLLGAHETMRYDEGRLLRFVRGRCLAYGAGGKLEYDLATLERQLIREVRAPLTKWEFKKFRFLDEQAAAGAQLRAVVPQRPLPVDLEARLREEVGRSAATANGCAQLTEQCVAFLLSTGSAAFGGDAGSTLLSVYLHQMLLVPDRLPSNAAEAEVQLGHLDAFLRLLHSAMNLDPMEGVEAKYRKELPKEAERAVTAALPEFDLQALLPVLQNFAAQHLGETYLKDDEAMKPILAMVETEAGGDLGDLEWFQAYFPEDGVLVQHWVAVFRLLAS